MKKVFIFIAALAFSTTVFAGGFVTNTNQNVRFLRNPARTASTEIDAIFSNPAGLSFMDGTFAISLNNQMAFQTRTIKSTFAPFVLNGEKETKEYVGKAQSFFIPSIQMAYKIKNNWVISGSFSIMGGGGTLEFKDGLPMFEAAVAGGLVQPLTQLNTTAANPDLGYTGNMLGYSLDMNLKGNSVTYGAQLGLNYKVLNMISFFAGARACIVQNGYKGHLRNVSITNADPVRTHFTNVAYMLENKENPTPLELGTAAALKNAAAGITQLELGADQINIKLNTQQKGWGMTPILGAHFNWKNLNIGVKYEFNTKIELKNKTKQGDNTTGDPSFDDGVKTRNDMPALFAAGVSYGFLKGKLTPSVGVHVFLDKFAKMPGNKQKYLKHNSYEILLGLEYVINDRFLVSAGAQITRLGITGGSNLKKHIDEKDPTKITYTDGFQSNISFYCNSFSIGGGFAVNIVKGLALNLAYFYTGYDKYTNKYPGYPGKEVYNRTSHTMGIGLDYKF